MIKTIENVVKTLALLLGVFAVSYVTGLIIRAALDSLYP